MDMSSTLAIASSGMQAQSQRLRIIAENLANADSTPLSADQDPYRRQIATFKSVMDRVNGVQTVKLGNIIKDESEFNTRYEPGHPAADTNGYIKIPNVNSLIEMMDMKQAQKTYEANLSVLELTKSMMLQTISSLRS